MRKLKSFILTLLISGGFLGAMYFIPVQIEKKQKVDFPVITEEEILLGEEKEEIIELPEVVDIPEIIIEETAKEPQEEPKAEEPSQPKIAKKEEPKKEEEQKNKKVENSKTKKEEKETSQKESRIGVDRKLVSGIPGTLNYKGKFPPHNVKEKGSITITYTVDTNGNVISAYRSDGLRDRNTINNAITLVRKYVKAEKSKNNSTGTYIIDFK